MAIARFQQERFVDWIEEALPLLRRHWHELAHYSDIPLDIDRKGYTALCAAGLMRIYTARLADKLVGYAVFIVGKNGHYHGSGPMAKQDVLYVDPAHRRGSLGIRLVRYADEMLRFDGVNVVYHHVKLAHPALGRVLEHLGYEPIETLYGRRLDTHTGTGALARLSGGEDANKAHAAAAELDESDRPMPAEALH
jgi:GNAT superfamily N-acetyltransferase